MPLQDPSPGSSEQLCIRERVRWLEQKTALLALPHILSSAEHTEQYWKILFREYMSLIGDLINEPPKISVSTWCSSPIQGTRFVKIKNIQ